MFLVFHLSLDWGFWWSLLATVLTVAAFRGSVDLVTRRYIPWPSLFEEESPEAMEADIVARRRVHAWRRVSFWVIYVGGFIAIVTTIAWLIMSSSADPGETVAWTEPLTSLL